MKSAEGIAERGGTRSQISRFLYYWLPVVVYVGLIFGGSSIPGSKVPVLFPYMDKLAHMAEYGIFGLLLGRAMRPTLGGERMNFWAYATVGIGGLVAALDELYQRLTPDRMSDVRDWGVDLAAVALAVLLSQYVRIHPIGRRREGASEREGR